MDCYEARLGDHEPCSCDPCIYKYMHTYHISIAVEEQDEHYPCTKLSVGPISMTRTQLFANGKWCNLWTRYYQQQTHTHTHARIVWMDTSNVLIFWFMNFHFVCLWIVNCFYEFWNEWFICRWADKIFLRWFLICSTIENQMLIKFPINPRKKKFRRRFHRIFMTDALLPSQLVLGSHNLE